MLASILLTVSALAGTMQVDILDVGQGDGVLITSPAGKRVLIDAGIKEAAVAEQLRRLGVTELSLVVATHPHADHISGLRDVVEQIPIKLYTDNGLPHTTETYTGLMTAIEAKKIPYKAAKQGQTYRLDDGIVLTVLFPAAKPLTDTRSDLNSNSVILRVDHGEDCFLFTGDAEEPTEDQLLRDGIGQCDVLKVAHHGSNHSSSSRFLAAVDPDIALISVGQDNRYEHPGDETLKRLQSVGATIYRTDHSGQISLASSGHGITVVDGMPWWSPPAAGGGGTRPKGAGGAAAPPSDLPPPLGGCLGASW